MTIHEATYEEVRMHLRHAEDAMRRLMSTNGDWSAKLQVRQEFSNVREACDDFAYHQCGVKSSRSTSAHHVS